MSPIARCAYVALEAKDVGVPEARGHGLEGDEHPAPGVTGDVVARDQVARRAAVDEHPAPGVTGDVVARDQVTRRAAVDEHPVSALPESTLRSPVAVPPIVLFNGYR